MPVSQPLKASFWGAINVNSSEPESWGFSPASLKYLAAVETWGTPSASSFKVLTKIQETKSC